MKNILISITIILFILFDTSKSEEFNNYTKASNIGLYGGLNINMHTPNFKEQGIVYNQNSIGYGLNAGIIANIPLTDIFVLSIRGGYNGLSGNFSKTILDTNYTLNSSLHYAELSPVLQFHNLLPIKDIYFMAGAELGLGISTKYSISMSPASKVELPSTEIPNRSFRIALAVGAGYVIPLSETMFLTPELSYRFPFTSVSSDANFKTWDVPQLRLSVALTFGFKSEKPKEVVEKPSEFSVAVKDVNYYDKEGSRHPLSSIKVEDVKYTELFPLVPYIFCDEDSVQPSGKSQMMRGTTEKGEFVIEKIEPDAMKINTSTLDIVGTRMKTIAGSDLTITGTNDNKKELADKEISRKRAEFAKDYIVKTYNINPERINIRAGALPEKASASTVADGIEENRRIELSSSNPKLLEPILIQKESQTIADPNVIEIVPAVVSTDSVTSWQLELSQAGETLKNFKGSGIPASQQFVIIPNELKSNQIPLDYSLSATNSKGLNKKANGSIPVEYLSIVRKKSEELPDRTISKYSLILFDFDKADVSEQDKKIVETYVLPEVKFNSTIKIYGYTDRIGDETYNKKLAERRAIAVKDLLSEKVKSAKYEVYGVGENEVIYDNNFPVGRQLSRTVQIYVITPR